MFTSFYFPWDEPCAKANRIFYFQSPAFSMHKRPSSRPFYIFKTCWNLFIYNFERVVRIVFKWCGNESKSDKRGCAYDRSTINVSCLSLIILFTKLMSVSTPTIKRRTILNTDKSDIYYHRATIYIYIYIPWSTLIEIEVIP